MIHWKYVSSVITRCVTTTDGKSLVLKWKIREKGNQVHPRNSQPGPHEILMFVCLQKDAKRCCDVTKA